MSRVKVNAQDVLDDIAAGMDDARLMDKYRLSARGLESLFRKLSDAGLVTESDLNRRMPLRENTVIVDFIPIPSSDLKWKFKTEDVVSSPLIFDGTVYFGSWDGNFYAVEIRTGTEKWRFKTNGSVHSRPAISSGLICFGSGDNSIYAVRFMSGKEKWKFETEAAVHSTPALGGGVVCFGSDDNHLYALESAGGGFSIRAWAEDAS